MLAQIHYLYIVHGTFFQRTKSSSDDVCKLIYEMFPLFYDQENEIFWMFRDIRISHRSENIRITFLEHILVCWAKAKLPVQF